MITRYINGSDYANIYGVFDDSGKQIGTVEICIAGINAGKKRFTSWAGKYNGNDIRRFYNSAMKSGTIQHSPFGRGKTAD